LGAKTRRPQVLVCYDLLKGLTYEKEDMIFDIELELLSLAQYTISNETISFLNVGVLNIRINGKFEPKQGISE
jgi:hypothetical protein